MAADGEGPFATLVSCHEERNDGHHATLCKGDENASCSANDVSSVLVVEAKSIEQGTNEVVEWEKGKVMSSRSVCPEAPRFQFLSVNAMTVGGEKTVELFEVSLERFRSIIRGKIHEMEVKIDHSVNRVKEIGRHLELKGRKCDLGM